MTPFSASLIIDQPFLWCRGRLVNPLFQTPFVNLSYLWWICSCLPTSFPESSLNHRTGAFQKVALCSWAL